MDLPDPGIELGSLALQADSLPTELSGEPSFRRTESPLLVMRQKTRKLDGLCLPFNHKEDSVLDLVLPKPRSHQRLRTSLTEVRRGRVVLCIKSLLGT